MQRGRALSCYVGAQGLVHKGITEGGWVHNLSKISLLHLPKANFTGIQVPSKYGTGTQTIWHQKHTVILIWTNFYIRNLTAVTVFICFIYIFLPGRSNDFFLASLLIKLSRFGCVIVTVLGVEGGGKPSRSSLSNRDWHCSFSSAAV